MLRGFCLSDEVFKEETRSVAAWSTVVRFGTGFDPSISRDEAEAGV